MGCVNGYLKNPRGRRKCRKKPRGRASYRGRSRRGASCKHGMLKNPTGGRRCRKAPRGRASYRGSAKRRRPAGMAKRGSHCTSFRKVRVRTGRGFRMQKRCKRYTRR